MSAAAPAPTSADGGLHFDIPEGTGCIATLWGKWGVDKTKVSTVTIPPSTTSIAPLSFWGCSSLIRVDIPTLVMSIGAGAFSGCSSLTTVGISPALTSLGHEAFCGCSSLSSVDLRSCLRLVEIGDGAFAGCISLRGVELPPALKAIGPSAFRECTNLQTLHFPSTTASVGRGAFYSCIALESIVFPEALTCVDAEQPLEDGLDPEERDASQGSFQGCTSLTTIVVPIRQLLRNRQSGRGASGRDGAVEASQFQSYIHQSTFRGCKNIRSVSAPDAVVSNLGDPYREARAFADLPEGVRRDAGTLQFKHYYWSVANGQACTADARKCVTMVFLVAARIATRAWEDACETAAAPAPTGPTLATAAAAGPPPDDRLPNLPVELWIMVLTMIRRSEFGVVQPKTLASVLQMVTRGHGYGRSGC